MKAITHKPQVLITDAVYAARRDALDTLTTAALKKECVKITHELAQAEAGLETGRVSGEDAYSLQCLRDWAQELLESRRNGYTGAYDA